MPDSLSALSGEAMWEIASARGKKINVKAKMTPNADKEEVRFQIRISGLEHPYLANKNPRYSGDETRNSALMPALDELRGQIVSGLESSLESRRLLASIPGVSWGEDVMDKIRFSGNSADEVNLDFRLALKNDEGFNPIAEFEIPGRNPTKAAKPEAVVAVFQDIKQTVENAVPRIAALMDEHQDKEPPPATEHPDQAGQYLLTIDGVRAMAVKAISWGEVKPAVANPPGRPSRN